MKRIKLFIFLFISIGIILGGCGEEDTSKTEKKISDEEMKEIRESLLENLEDIKNDREARRVGTGWLEPEDYLIIKREFNFLAKVASSNLLIDHNDKVFIDGILENLKKDIDNMSYDELSKVEELKNSASLIYETNVMDDLHRELGFLDISDGYIEEFVTRYGDETDVNVFYEKAEYYIESVERRIENIKEIEEYVSQISSMFNEDELTLLTDGLKKLRYSADKQKDIFTRFKPIYASDGTEFGDLLSQAKFFYNDAQSNVEELEEILDVEYSKY